MSAAGVWQNQRTIDREVPKTLAVHMLLDNYATHRHPAVKARLDPLYREKRAMGGSVGARLPATRQRAQLHI